MFSELILALATAGFSSAGLASALSLSDSIVGRWTTSSGATMVIFSDGTAKSAVDVSIRGCFYRPGDQIAQGITGGPTDYSGSEIACNGGRYSANFYVSDDGQSLLWSSQQGVAAFPYVTSTNWKKTCSGSDSC